MPSRKIHNLVNKLILGKSYDEVNRLVDLPYLWLRGKHRKYFHDMKTIPACITILEKDPKAGLAAAIHIWLDKFKFKKTR
jgi:hypothetical protein